MMKYPTLFNRFIRWLLIAFCLLQQTQATETLNKSQTDFDYLANLSIEELFDITVTIASKTDENLFNAPSSITVITQKEMRLWGLNSVQQVLNYVPGFFVSREVEQGNGNKVSVRGRNTALSEYVLFLLNGQRLNEVYSGGAMLFNRQFTVNNIERIEIIRGPGSTLYGSNAFLGVVNIITTNKINNLSLLIDDNNQLNIAANLSGQHNQWQWALYFNGFNDKGQTYYTANDIFDQNFATDDPSKGLDITLSIRNQGVNVFARHSERHAENFMTFGTIGNGINDEKTEQSSLQIGYETTLFDNLNSQLRVDYSEQDWDAVALLLPAGIATTTDFIGGPLLESSEITFNADFQYQLNQQLQLNFGGIIDYLSLDQADNQFNYDLTLTESFGSIRKLDKADSFNLEEQRHVTGLYLQAKYQPTDQLTLFAGTRHDEYSDFGSSTNPRIAIVYALTDSHKMKLMYGEAFRAPNFLELYDRNNPVDFGEPSLTAEKAKTIELAYGYNNANNSYNLTFFHTVIESQIEFGSVIPVTEKNPFGAPSFINSSYQVETSGMEGDFKQAINDHIILSGGFSHFFSSDEILTIPKNFGYFTLSSQIDEWQFGMTYLIRNRTPVMEQLQGYGVLNLNLRYNIAKNNYIQIGANNIFNKQYYVYSTLGLALPNRGNSTFLRWVLQY